MISYGDDKLNNVCTPDSSEEFKVTGWPDQILEAHIKPNKNKLCFGDSVHLRTLLKEGYKGKIAYKWINNSDTIGKTISPEFKHLPLKGISTYAVNISSDYKCTAGNYTTVPVEVETGTITAELKNNDTTLCEEHNYIGNPIIKSTFLPVTYAWYNEDGQKVKGSENSNSIFLNNSGTYYIISTDSICKSVKSNKINISIKSFPIVNAGPSLNIRKEDEAIVLNGSVADAENYTWTKKLDLMDPNMLSQNIHYLEEYVGEHLVELSANNGTCVSKSQTTILFHPPLNIPNTITANEDGLNDTWVIQGLEGYPNAKINIFNRWGDVVFSTKGSQHNWDGTCKGTGITSSTYYYVIELDPESSKIKTITRSLTVIR